MIMKKKQKIAAKQKTDRQEISTLAPTAIRLTKDNKVIVKGGHTTTIQKNGDVVIQCNKPTVWPDQNIKIVIDGNCQMDIKGDMKTNVEGNYELNATRIDFNNKVLDSREKG
jgi:phage gp45-like